MSRKPNINIEVSAGLVADTKLLVDDDMTAIKSLYLFKPNHIMSTFGLDNKANIINQKMLVVPQEIPKNDFMKLEFSNGLSIECTSNTLIFSIEGWKPARELTPELGILGGVYTKEMGIRGKVYHLTSADIMRKLIPQNVYFFATETQNILIPYVTPESDAITFVCIHQ